MKANVLYYFGTFFIVVGVIYFEYKKNIKRFSKIKINKEKEIEKFEVDIRENEEKSRLEAVKLANEMLKDAKSKVRNEETKKHLEELKLEFEKIILYSNLNELYDDLLIKNSEFQTDDKEEPHYEGGISAKERLKQQKNKTENKTHDRENYTEECIDYKYTLNTNFTDQNYNTYSFNREKFQSNKKNKDKEDGLINIRECKKCNTKNRMPEKLQNKIRKCGNCGTKFDADKKALS